MIGDLELGLQVRSSTQGPLTRHIGILGLHRDDMDRKDVDTASLDSINVATAGFLTPRAGATTKFEPLLMSSASAAPLPASRFNPMTDPATLREGFKPTGTRYAIAARITGPVSSAYPQGAPAAEKPASGPPVAHLAKSAVPANIVIVADTDMLMEYMWVQTREFLGKKIVASLRQQRRFRRQCARQSRADRARSSASAGARTFSRPFERVEALKRQADDRLQAKALELQQELQQTEGKLTEMQSKRNDKASLMLTPEQEQELKRFTAEKARVRKELRETQRGLDVDITRLDELAQGDQYRHRAARRCHRRRADPIACAVAAAARSERSRHEPRAFRTHPGRGADRDLRGALPELPAQLARATRKACCCCPPWRPSSTP